MITKLLGEKLIEKGLTIVTAESCTGGLIGNLITDVPGASRYFLGGIIAYSNEAKIKLLGVKKETLEEYGAVSEECAREMVIGVTNLFNSDIGIATTGIAGPSGGSNEKPVGLVYVGLKMREKVSVRRYFFDGNRKEIKRKIAEQAIKDVIDILNTK